MKVNSKIKIISILKRSDKPISGEDISREIGISRTAVWKNIKKLIDEGYTITSSSVGYLLKKEDDLLIPYEFNSDSNLFVYKETTESTMDIARSLIERGKALHGMVVVTESQTQGKANFGKEFISPKGGLYFTLTILQDLPLMNVNLYSMAALISIKEILLEELGLNVVSRWPFETWNKNKKISGILPEYKIENNRVKWLNIGIGINLNSTIPRRELLIKIKKRIFEYMESPDTVSFYYTNTLEIVGKTLSFRSEDKLTKGRVTSIDRLGTLTLKTDIGLGFAYVGNSTQEEINEN